MQRLRTDVTAFFTDLLMKARRGPKPVPGEIRVFGGRKYIYHSEGGWKYYGSGKGSKASTYHVEGVSKHPDLPSTPHIAKPEEATSTASAPEEKIRTRSKKVDDPTKKEATLEELTKDPRVETAEKIKKEYAKTTTERSEKSTEEDLAIAQAIEDNFDRTPSTLGGSSEVKLVNAAGNQYAVKKERGRSEGRSQLVHEVLADRLYNLVGARAPFSTLVEVGGKMFKASEYLTSARALGTVSPAIKKAAIDELKEHFVMDALLGNWDVVGASEDNILIKDGHIVRIDNGSSFKHRARGAEKPASDWATSTKVGEIDSMRDSGTAGTNVFQSVTDADIREQVEILKHFRNDILAKVDEFAAKHPEAVGAKEVLEKRMDWLEKNYSKSDKVEAAVKDYDKALYSSAATAKYFEELESFELNIHDNYKANFVQHAKKIETKYASYFENYAKEHGISVEEYKTKLQSHAERLMQQSSYFRATDLGVLDKILLDEKDARFKSQFETSSSHGSYSPTSRARVESKYFGWDSDTLKNKEMRPIYGYCSDNENGVNNSSGTNPPSNNAAQYGGVTLRIKKDHALKHATVTFSDSLGVEESMTASPVVKPHFTSLPLSHGDPLKKIDSTGKRSTYTEIQYHNQLKAEHIESVHISLAAASSSEYGAKQVEQALGIARKTHLDFKFYNNK